VALDGGGDPEPADRRAESAGELAARVGVAGARCIERHGRGLGDVVGLASDQLGECGRLAPERRRGRAVEGVGRVGEGLQVAAVAGDLRGELGDAGVDLLLQGHVPS
jgi:hypothetical protein